MTKPPLVLKSVVKLASVMTPSFVSGSFHNIAVRGWLFEGAVGGGLFEGAV